MATATARTTAQSVRDTAPTSVGAPLQRIASIDLVRGAIMVLMAIDHVRVYSGVPAGGPTPGVFFTRWVTHFCAPGFVFFAGTSAFLLGRRLGRAELSRYLITRGLLLVLLELTVLKASWTFNLDYSHFLLAGVIWMLGWCMVLLSVMIRLPLAAVGVIGLLIIVAQGAFAGVGGLLPPSLHPMWEFIYPLGGEVHLGQNGPAVTVLYTIVPWIGVMGAGYAFGSVLVRSDEERWRWCTRIGVVATVLFLILAGAGVAQGGGPNAPPAYIRFLNQRKYPASVPFLLMTLGPMIAVLPFTERARGWFANVMATFGRVPMFYYLLHIPLIHAVSLLVWLMRDGAFHQERFVTAPYVSMPPEQRWSLALLYVVWAIVIAILYPLCRWYAHDKALRPRGWMRYI